MCLVVICISPFLSIMLDQQEKCRKDHFTIDFVGEAQKDPMVFKRVVNGDVQVHYISPENILENPKFGGMLLTST